MEQQDKQSKPPPGRPESPRRKPIVIPTKNPKYAPLRDYFWWSGLGKTNRGGL